MTVKTTFARGINPFQGPAPIPPTPKPAMQKPSEPKTKPRSETIYIDVAGLEIKNDPLPPNRALPMHKYHPVFDRMKVGQCVRCLTKDVGKVSGALRKYMEIKRKPGQVRTTTTYPNDAGYGRVWMLANPVKANQAKR